MLATLAAIFVGLGKGGLPIIAGLAVPGVSLVMLPIVAAGLLLPVYIVSDIFAFSAYWRDYDKQVLIITLIGMIIGVVLGVLTAQIVFGWVVLIFISLIGALIAIRTIPNSSKGRDRTYEINNNKGYLWCTIAGFTSFINHNSGSSWQIFVLPTGLPKTVFVGTSVISFSYCNAIKLIPYYWLGQMNLSSFKITPYLMIPSAVVVYAGVRIVKLIPEVLFFKVVSWALLLISLKLIWDGITAAIS